MARASGRPTGRPPTQHLRGEVRSFVFDLTYFYPSGRFHSSTSYEYRCATVTGTDDPFLSDLVSHLRGLARAGGHDLPGLIPSDLPFTGTILIDYFDSFSFLLTL